jgi:hypothetical protein
MTTTRKQYDQYIAECNECAAGSRGFVVCSKVRAENMGLQFGSLKVPAEMKGLKVYRHGRLGYIAIRP